MDSIGHVPKDISVVNRIKIYTERNMVNSEFI